MLNLRLPRLSNATHIGSVLVALGALLLPVWGAQLPGTEPTAAATSPAGSPTIERFQDWRITCTGDLIQRFCTLAQEIRRRDENRHVLLLEVMPLGVDHALARLTLPFGLALKAEVILQIDNSSKIPAKLYHSCMQDGCLVTLNLDTNTLTALKRGQTLQVSAPILTGGTANFTLSLKGFTAAYARLVTLAGALQSAKQ